MKARLVSWIQATLMVIVAGGSSSIAYGNHPLERQAECLENKTDALHDLIDDDFERSPDYRFLCNSAGRLDDWAEDLEDEIDDEDWGCAQGLVYRIQCEAQSLQGIVARQPACYVRGNSIERALCLLNEISQESAQLGALLQGASPFASTPVITPAWPGANYPHGVYRPTWPRDPRFQRVDPLWQDPPFDGGEWQNVPPEQPLRGSRRTLGIDWNRTGVSPSVGGPRPFGSAFPNSGMRASFPFGGR